MLLVSVEVFRLRVSWLVEYVHHLIWAVNGTETHCRMLPSETSLRFTVISFWLSMFVVQFVNTFISNEKFYSFWWPAHLKVLLTASFNGGLLLLLLSILSLWLVEILSCLPSWLNFTCIGHIIFLLNYCRFCALVDQYFVKLNGISKQV